MDVDDIIGIIQDSGKSNSRLLADQILAALRRARARIQELGKEIAELEAQVQSKQTEVDKIGTEVTKKTARIEQLEKQLEENQGGGDDEESE